jgi:predicted O-methyltransferase YrrM
MIAKHGFRRGAEIGSGTGRTAMELLRTNPEFHLTIVAFYPNHMEHYGSTPRAQKLFRQRLRRFPKEGVRVLWMPSHEASFEVPDHQLDFVFIDADHSYEHCLEDIRDWAPKVRPGGLICGHDMDHPDFPGVRKAVEEYFGTDFEVLNHDWMWYSWKRS